jgi:hypothetical protein
VSYRAYSSFEKEHERALIHFNEFIHLGLGIMVFRVRVYTKAMKCVEFFLEVTK